MRFSRSARKGVIERVINKDVHVRNHEKEIREGVLESGGEEETILARGDDGVQAGGLGL
jgi:hypothetical protein